MWNRLYLADLCFGFSWFKKAHRVVSSGIVAAPSYIICLEIQPFSRRTFFEMKQPLILYKCIYVFFFLNILLLMLSFKYFFILENFFWKGRMAGKMNLTFVSNCSYRELHNLCVCDVSWPIAAATLGHFLVKL